MCPSGRVHHQTQRPLVVGSITLAPHSGSWARSLVHMLSSSAKYSSSLMAEGLLSVKVDGRMTYVLYVIVPLMINLKRCGKSAIGAVYAQIWLDVISPPMSFGVGITCPRFFVDTHDFEQIRSDLNRSLLGHNRTGAAHVIAYRAGSIGRETARPAVLFAPWFYPECVAITVLLYQAGANCFAVGDRAADAHCSCDQNYHKKSGAYNYD